MNDTFDSSDTPSHDPFAIKDTPKIAIDVNDSSSSKKLTINNLLYSDYVVCMLQMQLLVVLHSKKNLQR